MLDKKFTANRTGPAEWATDLAKEGVAAIRQSEKTKDGVVDELDTTYTDKLKRSP